MVRAFAAAAAVALSVASGTSAIGSDQKTDQPLKTSVRVSVRNDSGRIVQEVYISPSHSAKWGPNLIQRPLAPGGRVVVHTRTGCGPYDIRMVADGKTEFLEEEVQLCENDDELRVQERALKKEKPVR